MDHHFCVLEQYAHTVAVVAPLSRATRTAANCVATYEHLDCQSGMKHAVSELTAFRSCLAGTVRRRGTARQVEGSSAESR
jgi:hypothetical protein